LKAAGRLVGLMIYNKFQITGDLSTMFLAKLTGKLLGYEALGDYNAQVLSGFDYARENEDLEGLPVPESAQCDREDWPSTDAERIEILDRAVMNYVTYLSPKQFDEFTGGLFDIVPREVFESGLLVTELRSLLFGQLEIDDQDLYNHWTLTDYDESSEHIQWLKRIFSSWSQENRRNFVECVTGNPQLPPGGFGSLAYPIAIRYWEASLDKLPEVHACFSQLDLPPYTSEDQMRKKLELAIGTPSEFSML
jgi:hypothetical protein